MPLSVKDTHRALVRAGFAHESRPKHDFYIFVHKGQDTELHTAMSRSYSELSDPMIAKMACDIGLRGNKKALVQFVSGRMSVGDFRSLLIRQIEPSPPAPIEPPIVELPPRRQTSAAPSDAADGPG